MTRRFFAILFLFAMSISSLPPATSAEPLSEEDERDIRLCLRGYLKYAESFPFYTCDYEMRHGFAKSREKILKENVTDESGLSKCRFVQDGEKYSQRELVVKKKPKEDLKPEPNKEPGQKKALKEAVESSSTIEIFDGELSFGCALDHGIANLHEANSRRRYPDRVPMSLDRSDLLGTIRRRLKALDDATSEFRVERDAKNPNLITVGVRRKGTAHSTDKITFDRDRGYLIVKAVFCNGDTGLPMVTSTLVETADCGDGRLFPIRWTIWDDVSIATGEKFFYREMRVVKFDVKTKPTAKEFAMEIPSGTSIILLRDPKLVKMFRLKEAESVTPDDLPKLKKRCEESK